MSKKTTETKHEKQTEAKKPVELKDEELEGASAGKTYGPAGVNIGLADGSVRNV